MEKFCQNYAECIFIFFGWMLFVYWMQMLHLHAFPVFLSFSIFFSAKAFHVDFIFFRLFYNIIMQTYSHRNRTTVCTHTHTTWNCNNGCNWVSNFGWNFSLLCKNTFSFFCFFFFGTLFKQLESLSHANGSRKMDCLCHNKRKILWKFLWMRIHTLVTSKWDILTIKSFQWNIIAADGWKNDSISYQLSSLLFDYFFCVKTNFPNFCENGQFLRNACTYWMCAPDWLLIKFEYIR